MSNAPFTTEIPVRFRDVDAMRHVNNAVYVTYLEETRVAYWRSRFGEESTKTFDVIIGQVMLRYLGSVELQHSPITVAMGCCRIGNKSFDLAYEIRKGDRVFVAAKTTQVGFNYQTQKTEALNDTFLAALKNDAWTPDWADQGWS